MQGAHRGKRRLKPCEGLSEAKTLEDKENIPVRGSYTVSESLPLLCLAWLISCSSLEGSEGLKDALNQDFLTWLMSTDLCRAM